jgi:hypothetical protein
MALKVLKAHCTQVESIRKAFIAEARLLERLEHPGLVRCFGVARSGNTFFSRLEYVDGSTLLELLDNGRRFTEDEALRGIGHRHRAGGNRRAQGHRSGPRQRRSPGLSQRCGRHRQRHGFGRPQPAHGHRHHQLCESLRT